MSFYTIDGNYLKKKKPLVEGFFQNKIIEHGLFAGDTGEDPPQYTTTEDEINPGVSRPQDDQSVTNIDQERADPANQERADEIVEAQNAANRAKEDWYKLIVTNNILTMPAHELRHEILAIREKHNDDTLFDSFMESDILEQDIGND